MTTRRYLEAARIRDAIGAKVRATDVGPSEYQPFRHPCWKAFSRACDLANRRLAEMHAAGGW